MQFIYYYLQNAMDITYYFLPSVWDNLDSRALNLITSGTSQSSILSAAGEINNLASKNPALSELKGKGKCCHRKLKNM